MKLLPAKLALILCSVLILCLLLIKPALSSAQTTYTSYVSYSSSSTSEVTQSCQVGEWPWPTKTPTPTRSYTPTPTKTPTPTLTATPTNTPTPTPTTDPGNTPTPTPTTDPGNTPTPTPITGANCTFSQGYWKTHSSAWPVSSLTLGTVSYNKTQLLQIMNQPVAGNGLISLSYQLIAAKLNIANGASSASIAAAISQADTLIGNKVVPPVGSGSLTPASTSSLITQLTNYNTGITGPGHCN